MPRFLWTARDPGSIEPLGLHYLDEIPRQEGWDSDIELIEKDNFEPLFENIRHQKPDMVGFHVWAGYHLPMLAAADRVRAMGIPVVMGGPYATYSHTRCEPHADWVVRASGFEILRKILQGQLKPGVHFDPQARHEMFPVPSRRTLYRKYKKFLKSAIKSIFGSVGCPYKCTYCHAPEFNALHGGFDLILRSVDDVIAEALIVMEYSPETRLFYFQDDVFGFEWKKWLPEFARRWRQEVGMPFHVQMRLEMIEGPVGDRRIQLLKEAGCTGVTLAIESGSAFLRKHVLFRPMAHELIVEGCKKIMAAGMTLRTEQIGMVPLSDISTDLLTLWLNVVINPTMAWSSIFSPFPGVNLGLMAGLFGMWEGTNDDIKESFLEESILHHLLGGPQALEAITNKIVGLSPDQEKEVLLRMKAIKRNGGQKADLQYQHVEWKKFGKSLIPVNVGKPNLVGEIEYLSDAANDTYRKQGVRMQRLFNGLAKMPEGEKLGKEIVELGHNEWGWEKVGELTEAHLRKYLPADTLEGHRHALAHEMGLEGPGLLPDVIAKNPHYFTRFPAGGELALKVAERGLFGPEFTTDKSFDEFGAEVRWHLFDYGVYKVKDGAPPIAR
jgi:hypothetical protein